MTKKDQILQVGKDILKMASININHTQEMLDESFIDAVELLNNTSGKIILSGIGKSGIIAKKITATLCSTGTFSYFIHPNEAFHGDFGMIKPDDTIIVFTHSGETKELISFLEIIKGSKFGNKVIAITSKNNSKIVKFADIILQTHVVKESDDEDIKLIPTTSTTVTLALGDALAIALQKLKGFKIEHFYKYHPGGKIGSELRMIINEKDN